MDVSGLFLFDSMEINDLLLFAFNVSWFAAITAIPVFALVCVLTGLGKRWLAPWARQALWSLVLLRLMMPVSIASPLSLQPSANWLYGRLAEVVSPTSRISIRAFVPEGESDVRLQVTDDERIPHSPLQQTVLKPDQPLPKSRVIPWDEFVVTRILAIVFWIGVILTTAWTLTTSVRLHHWIHPRTICEQDEWLALLTEGKRLFGIDGTVQLWIVPKLTSPATYGWWQPAILLPGTASQLSTCELRHVIWHELAHVSRHDVAQNWVLALIRIVQWWNPVFWWAASAWIAERELACDALVMRYLAQDQSRSYGNTLLRFLEELNLGVRRVPALAAPGLVMILGGKRTLKNRLRQLALLAKPERTWQRWTAYGLITALGASGLTDATPFVLQDPLTTAFELPDGTTWKTSSPNTSDDQLAVQYADALDQIWRVSSARARDMSSPNEAGDDEPRIVISYEATPVVTRLRESCTVEQDTSDDGILKAIRWQIKWDFGHRPPIAPNAGTEIVQPDTKEIHPASSCEIEGTRLIVHATAKQHEKLQHRLKRWELVGWPQITIEVRCVATGGSLKDLLPKIGGQILSPDRSNGYFNSAEVAVNTSTHTWTERGIPAFIQLINTNEVEGVMQRLQGDLRTNLMFAPKITMFDGNWANVRDEKQRPFVTGLRTLKHGGIAPEISKINEGGSFRIYAEASPDLKSVQLRLRCEQSSLLAVHVLQIQTTGKAESVQVPQLSRSLVDIVATVPDGDSLLVTPLERDENGVLQMFLIRPRLICSF